MEVGKVIKRGEDLFFFSFSLLKTTEICFGSTKMEIFYRGKTFHAGQKIRLCPLRKICLLRPWPCIIHFTHVALKLAIHPNEPFVQRGPGSTSGSTFKGSKIYGFLTHSWYSKVTVKGSINFTFAFSIGWGIIFYFLSPPSPIQGLGAPFFILTLGAETSSTTVDVDKGSKESKTIPW